MSKNIVAFSGIDGCGKSTQIEKLSRYYDDNDIKYKVFWVRPGSTPFILFIKSIARFFFRSLPKAGRSEQREKLMKKSKVGRLWFYLTFIDLIYIFKIKTPLTVLLGHKVIFDRHIFDSIIDYQIMLDMPVFDTKLVKMLLGADKNIIKIYLEIPIQDSIDRCEQKWEPFPDTEQEKIIRDRLYKERITGFNYTQIDGLSQPELIHQSIMSLIKGN